MAMAKMMGEEPSLLEAFGADEEMPDEEVSEGGAEERAITDFFESGDSGDYAAATEAFKRAYRLCAKSKPAAEEKPASDEASEYLEE